MVILSNMKDISGDILKAGNEYYDYRIRTLKRKSPIGVIRQLIYCSYLTASNVGELVRKPYPILQKSVLDGRVYIKAVKLANWNTHSKSMEGIFPIYTPSEAQMFAYLMDLRFDEPVPLDFSRLNIKHYPMEIVSLYANLRRFLDFLYKINPPLPESKKEYGFSVLKELRIYDLLINNNCDARLFVRKEKTMPKITGDLGKLITERLMKINVEALVSKKPHEAMTYSNLMNVIT